MVATISFNPGITTVAAGSFSIQTTGLIQGTAYDSPNSRFNLAGGLLSDAETIPMWGGVGISETTAPATGALAPDLALGGRITRATTLTAAAAGQLTGFSVFDQDHAMVNNPQSPVPLALSRMLVNFYRLGSGARIAVACDPSLVNLEGNVITQNVSWDFNNQCLQPYVASGGTESVTSMTWSSTNGGQVAVVMGSASIYGLGDTITVAGATNTGTGAVSLINAPHVINTWTDSTHFTFLLPGDSSIWGTIGGTITLVRGVGALPVKVLEVNVGNSMTVVRDPVTGFVTWNRSGTCAVILI
jgi:hypothetical protein